MLFSSIKNNLQELRELLEQLSAEQYSSPCEELGGATIGGHYRHVIEIFLCLIDNYEDGKVNYDNRKRDIEIQTDPIAALQKIDYIHKNIERSNKPILLEQTLQQKEIVLESNYFRELLYNMEHAIHHQALIKIGARRFKTINIHEDFGVARSTIAYRKRCVS